VVRDNISYQNKFPNNINITNDGGSRAASGVYFYILELQSTGQKKEGKLVVIL